MKNGEISFDFELTKENEKALKELLNAKGLVHYMIETKEKEKLDLVEYKDYQQLEQEIQKYKSLYENEKEHTDTLKRIIKEVKKYLEGAYEMATYTNSVCLDEENIEDILDLLKEIK